MNLDIAQVVGILANIGVIAGIVFLVIEIRQNNRFLAAQARYSLRQYRSDMIDTFLSPHVMAALQRHASGQETTPAERGTALMIALKAFELWEWQWGEYMAGMLKREELPIANWRNWYHGEGITPVPLAEAWPGRKLAMNPAFVRFFEDHVVNYNRGARTADSTTGAES